MQNTSHILDLLFAEREKIEKAIAALQGDPPAWVTDTKLKPVLTMVPSPATAPVGKRTISAATRKKMAEGQKRRHAEALAKAAKKKKAA